MSSHAVVIVVAIVPVLTIVTDVTVVTVVTNTIQYNVLYFERVDT